MSNLTYDQAYQELSEILAEIQSEEVSIDSLATKLKRANELKTFCQEKLRSISAEIEDLTKSDS